MSSTGDARRDALVRFVRNLEGLKFSYPREPFPTLGVMGEWRNGES
jgi:hypothetical protein